MKRSHKTAYHSCLLDEESVSSSDHMDQIIIAQVYTMNMTRIAIITLLINVRIRKPTLLISVTIFHEDVPTSKDTSSIAVVPGISIKGAADT